MKQAVITGKIRFADSFIFGYTRSRDNGEILNYHRKDVANTIHGSTGAGGNTDQFAAVVYENE